MNEEQAQLISSYQLKIKKLERELRITKSAYEKLTIQFRAKEALEEAMYTQNVKQRNYMGMLLENTPCMIVVMDLDGCYRLCTQSFLDAVGVPNFDYIDGKPFSEILKNAVSESDFNAITHVFKQFGDGKTQYRFDRYLTFKSIGIPRYYAIECHRIPQTEHREECYLTILVDTTELEEQKIQAENANRSKSDFLAAMSHEIRTPMNAVIGLNDILSRTPLDDSQQKYLADMRSSARTLLGIINDILDFSKVESGKMDIINVPYNLRELLKNVYSMYLTMFQGKDLTFEMEIDDNLPEWTEGDELRVRQSITNVLSNAFKYTKTGGAKLKAYLDEETNMLTFVVSDTGIGIKELDLPNIFTPFVRFDIIKTRSIQGTGLGMPISHQFCELMGGSIEAKSVYGEGSVFTIKLPYVKTETHLENTEIIETINLPDLKILVVDDIEINLVIVSTMLESMGIIADTVESAEQAFQITLEKEYDLIFMDHMMPEIDGIVATKILRTRGGWLENVPIIALTANVVNGAEQNFLDNGFSGFLPKPLELGALTACINKIFAHR
jgi:signal transduction histidine kinase